MGMQPIWGTEQYNLFCLIIDLNSQKRKFILFRPPDWRHSHDVQGVSLHYYDCEVLKSRLNKEDALNSLDGVCVIFYSDRMH